MTNDDDELEQLLDLFIEEEDIEDVELLSEGAAQAVKVPGAGDAKRKKSTVIKKPSGPDDTGGKKKRVLPKTGGGSDARKKRKA
jgi:hypothetical protein